MIESTLWILSLFGYFLTWLLIPFVLLKRRSHPSGTVAWILSFLFVPYLGAIVYIIFGSTRWERRAPRKREAVFQVDRLAPDWLLGSVLEEEHIEAQLGRWRPLAALVRRMTSSPVTAGNRVQHLFDTNHSLGLLENVIREAEHWIDVEFYIWRQDKAGTRLRDLLIEKARQGVQVRLLYDGIGSLFLSSGFLRPLRKAGVQVASFTPGLHLWHLLTLNLRNHRKIVVADGKVAFTGGMNIGDEYFRPTASYGEWRDAQVLVHGPAALQLHHVFAGDWYYATGELLTGSEFYPPPTAVGGTPVQMVADGPDDDVDTFYSLLVATLAEAKERVTLTTPYFIPPDAVAMSLETAARRGIRTRLLVAGRGNFAATLYAGRSYYEGLLKAGVEVFEYQKGLYHAKTLVVDGQWLLVGTPNCDYRSMFLNFEVALSIFDPELAADLERQLQDDMQSARRLDLASWQQRAKTSIVAEQFWRLFAPIL